MWITLKISSRARLDHGDKREIPAVDTVLFHSNLSSLKYSSDVPCQETKYIVLISGPKISKRLSRRLYWWLKNKERKYHFRSVERRFLATIKGGET